MERADAGLILSGRMGKGYSIESVGKRRGVRFFLVGCQFTIAGGADPLLYLSHTCHHEPKRVVLGTNILSDWSHDGGCEYVTKNELKLVKKHPLFENRIVWVNCFDSGAGVRDAARSRSRMARSTTSLAGVLDSLLLLRSLHHAN